jgi:nicotinate-nucleotide adenylyltransferase
MTRFFDGAKVALFGGSFDPPHDGHYLVAEAALRALRVDYVWWLVAPQNPLKAHAPAGTRERVRLIKQRTNNRHFIVSDEETDLRTRYAVDTVKRLQARHPRTKFIWLIGADNLAQLHRWKDWQGLMRRVPVAVYPRPGDSHKAALAPAAAAFSWARLNPLAAAHLADYQAPAWVMLDGKHSRAASSALRQMDD